MADGILQELQRLLFHSQETPFPGMDKSEPLPDGPASHCQWEAGLAGFVPATDRSGKN
ncbi:hypothetical protein ECDEC6A_3653 [Escherichia coli DEC6A]|nr:hypothetical protein ECDEC6A_3653 [Escherichia coli DEC6A]